MIQVWGEGASVLESGRGKVRRVEGREGEMSLGVRRGGNQWTRKPG